MRAGGELRQSGNAGLPSARGGVQGQVALQQPQRRSVRVAEKGAEARADDEALAAGKALYPQRLTRDPVQRQEQAVARLKAGRGRVELLPSDGDRLGAAEVAGKQLFDTKPGAVAGVVQAGRALDGADDRGLCRLGGLDQLGSALGVVERRRRGRKQGEGRGQRAKPTAGCDQGQLPTTLTPGGSKSLSSFTLA